MRVMLKTLAFLIILALVAFAAYVRLAPSDAAVWNMAIATTDPATPGACVDKVVLVPKGARATCLLAGTPADTLAKLDAAAMAKARVTRLAGSPGEGRITWVSRSALMGYPDYITAEAIAAPEGTRLDILSRQRFGQGDSGVNAARLKDWLGSL